jgi:L-threonylcarbamoyladenylate synthase
MEAFSPGPITYLLDKNLHVPDVVTAGSKKVAIRIPDHPLTIQLLASLSFPLAAPSANPSGYVSPVSAEHVLQGLQGRIPYILDGGNARIGLESTIVGFKDGETIVHRLGGIGLEQIEKVIGKSVKVSITHDAPETPGQLKRHYATKKNFIVGDLENLKAAFAEKKFGVISFCTIQSENIPHVVLSLKGDLAEAASKLFAAMREMDNQNIDIILAEWVPDHGIGRAINDRLKRAIH